MKILEGYCMEFVTFQLKKSPRNHRDFLLSVELPLSTYLDWVSQEVYSLYILRYEKGWVLKNGVMWYVCGGPWGQVSCLVLLCT